MQDVVCQLVGFGLVPRYVMKADGVEAVMLAIPGKTTTRVFYDIILKRYYIINNRN